MENKDCHLSDIKVLNAYENVETKVNIVQLQLRKGVYCTLHTHTHTRNKEYMPGPVIR